MIAAKHEFLTCFKEHLTHTQHHTGRKLKCLQPDKCCEYAGNEFLKLMKDHGIASRRYFAQTPQQNGVAERICRILLDMVRSTLEGKLVHNAFWGDAVTTAAYIHNRVASVSLHANTTPFEL